MRTHIHGCIHPVCTCVCSSVRECVVRAGAKTRVRANGTKAHAHRTVVSARAHCRHWWCCRRRPHPAPCSSSCGRGCALRAHAACTAGRRRAAAHAGSTLNDQETLRANGAALQRDGLPTRRSHHQRASRCTHARRSRTLTQPHTRARAPHRRLPTAAPAEAPARAAHARVTDAHAAMARAHLHSAHSGAPTRVATTALCCTHTHTLHSHAFASLMTLCPRPRVNSARAP